MEDMSWRALLRAGSGEPIFVHIGPPRAIAVMGTCSELRQSIGHWLDNWVQEHAHLLDPLADASLCTAQRAAVLCNKLALCTQHGLGLRAELKVRDSASLLGMDSSIKAFEPSFWRVLRNLQGRRSEIEYSCDENTFVALFNAEPMKSTWLCKAEEGVDWCDSKDPSDTDRDNFELITGYDEDVETKVKFDDLITGTQDGDWLQVAMENCVGNMQDVWLPLQDARGEPNMLELDESLSDEKQASLKATANLIGEQLNCFMHPVLDQQQAANLMDAGSLDCIAQLLPDADYSLSLVQAQVASRSTAAEFDAHLEQVNEYYQVWDHFAVCSGASEIEDADDYVCMPKVPVLADSQREGLQAMHRRPLENRCDNIGHLILSQCAQSIPAPMGILCTQSHEQLNQDRVSEYQREMASCSASCCPTVLVYRVKADIQHESRLCVLDGHHKLEAARRLRAERIKSGGALPRLNFLIIAHSGSEEDSGEREWCDRREEVWRDRELVQWMLKASYDCIDASKESLPEALPSKFWAEPL